MKYSPEDLVDQAFQTVHVLQWNQMALVTQVVQLDPGCLGPQMALALQQTLEVLAATESII